MYAYQKKYDAKKVMLLYPASNRIFTDKTIMFRSDDGVVVEARFIDLFNAVQSVQEIDITWRQKTDGTEGKRGGNGSKLVFGWMHWLL